MKVGMAEARSEGEEALHVAEEKGRGERGLAARAAGK